MNKIFLLTAIIFLVSTFQTMAQTITPTAIDSDVMSQDAILSALYEVISGDSTKVRDWNRFRSLFHSSARLIPTGKNAKTGETTANALTVEDYIKRAEPFMMKDGFFEREIARQSDTYGNISQIFSTYESRHKFDDAKPFARGINGIQLFFDSKRWYVMTIFWDSETSEKPIPKDYLKSQKKKRFGVF